MEFCPNCGMLLQYELPHLGRPARFFCPVCPYVCQLESKAKLKRKQHLVKKKIDPVYDYDDFKNASTTDENCPKCGHGKAAFRQFQNRSADEPMTTSYACMNETCRHQWREN